MRVTCDIDCKSSLKIGYIILKGLYHFGKLPDKIENSEKGVHLIYMHLDMDEKECFKFRKMLGDDSNRIRLDMETRFKPPQILFIEKNVTCNKFIHRNWVKKIGAINKGICGCHRRVLYSEKLWNDNERCIKVHHKDYICVFPLKTRIPMILNLMSRFGVDVMSTTT